MGISALVHDGWRAPHPQTRKYAEPELTAGVRDPEFAARLRGLTRHERNLLRSRCEGLCWREVGNRYGIKESSVKNLLNIAFRKLDLGGMGSSARACYLLGRYDADVDGDKR